MSPQPTEGATPRPAVFATVDEALEMIRQGQILVVIDDEHRENEGDLLMAAEKCSAEHVNFMARWGRGLICVPMEGARLDELRIPQMVQRPGDHMGTAFTVSVDARGCTTGISAHERALTIRALIDPATQPQDLVQPGHIFPLRYKEGGVLRRPGHTEAAVDLARLAGLQPAGVICEIMNEDGTMARTPELIEFAQRHGLRVLTIADLIRYRMARERLITRVAEVRMPTRFGDFRAIGYDERFTRLTHVALVKGDVTGEQPVLVRVHSECLTGDAFHSLRCDCGEQLEAAFRRIAAEGRGVLLYMRQEGRGIGLSNKLRAYELQDQGKDTVEANEALGFPADMRDYGVGAQILVDLGISQLRLMTNNPKKSYSLAGYGLRIVERVPLQTQPNANNERYLAVKRDKLGHLLGG